MKSKIFAACCILLALLLAGCGGQDASQSFIYAAPPSSSSWAPIDEIQSGDGHSLDADGQSAKEGDIVDIREKMFIAQTNDIYMNFNDYMGKTLRYEGMLFSDWDEGLERTVYYVVRYGPGCCGYDSTAGFEVRYEPDTKSFPEDNSWVEVTGELKEYFRNGWQVLYVELSSLEIKTERGLETVLQ